MTLIPPVLGPRFPQGQGSTFGPSSSSRAAKRVALRELGHKGCRRGRGYVCVGGGFVPAQAHIRRKRHGPTRSGYGAPGVCIGAAPGRGLRLVCA
eukprot:2838260-Rhodomonas_salina.2